MTLTPGTRLGPYEIQSAVGAGGMGEVYRARDTRLDRTVALKILPPDFAGDPQFRARFNSEARTISQLSHPHICTLHDIGDQEGIAYLVMELLDGETLQARLARVKGPLPLDEVVKIGIEVAGALHTAHRAGITHRDLKPANIMLTKGGAKLLDFGLAKQRRSVVPLSASAMERKATSDGPGTGTGTAAGTILGTIHYMAPEQVEGRDADARSDLWALGVVIYETATGQRPFEGDSAASVIGAILKDAPAPMSSRQPLTPAALEHLVNRCLKKDPEERWQSAGDLGSTLQWAVAGSNPPSNASEGLTSTRTRARVAWTLASGLAGLALGVFFGWRYLSPQPAPPPVVQFDVLPPLDATLSPAPVAGTPQLALSPDGRHLAFVAMRRRRASQIYVRSTDGREARALPDTDGASFPFWSGDSAFIAFFADGKLKKIAVAGGTAQVLCDAPAGRGGTWNADGDIVFSATPNSGTLRVSAAGGQPTAVTTLARGRQAGGGGEADEQAIGHNWPQFLPDGRHFLFYQRAVDSEHQGIYVGELGTSYRSPRVLAINGVAVYSSGYLAFVRDGVLLAQAFDERTFELSGQPIRIADHVGYFSGSFGFSAIAASRAGLLAYGPAIGTTTSLEWFTRAGATGGRLGNAGIYVSPRLSFDQKTVVVAIAGETMAERDIWNLDVARNNPSRVTFDPGADWFPAWTPDGQRLYFGSTRLGITTMFQKAGVGQDEIVDKRTALFATYPNDVSSDGRLIVYTQSTEAGYDLGVTTLGSPPQMAPFLVTNFNEVQARFAPNQRWIAYASNESGQFEVYVRPYPASNAQQWKISTAGGMQPEWRRDGKELFYIATDGKLMSLAVSSEGATFEAGVPRPLFGVEVPEPIGPYPTHYAVTADGQRFLVNTVIDQPTRPALTVILNWTGLLK